MEETDAGREEVAVDGRGGVSYVAEARRCSSFFSFFSLLFSRFFSLCRSIPLRMLQAFPAFSAPSAVNPFPYTGGALFLSFFPFLPPPDDELYSKGCPSPPKASPFSTDGVVGRLAALKPTQEGFRRGRLKRSLMRSGADRSVARAAEVVEKVWAREGRSGGKSEVERTRAEEGGCERNEEG